MKRVIIDRPFTYPLDANRRRTLPTGWRGALDDKLAREIARRKFGRILPQSAKAPKPAPDAGKDDADSDAGGDAGSDGTDDGAGDGTQG